MCCEVTGYTSTDETLTSVQVSIALPKFLVDVDGMLPTSFEGGRVTSAIGFTRPWMIFCPILLYF